MIQTGCSIIYVVISTGGRCDAFSVVEFYCILEVSFYGAGCALVEVKMFETKCIYALGAGIASMVIYVLFALAAAWARPVLL